MRRRTTALATLVLVLVAPVAACTDGDGRPTAEPTSPSSTSSSSATVDGARGRVEALLERRAAAILDRDDEAFAAGIAPGPARADQLRGARSASRRADPGLGDRRNRRVRRSPG